MDNLPKGLTLDSDTFGIVVNNQPEPDTQVEQQIKAVEAPFKALVKLNASELTRFDRVVQDSQMTRDEYIAKLIRERIDSVSKPTITAPSFAKGGRITGPTYSVSRAS